MNRNYIPNLVLKTIVNLLLDNRYLGFLLDNRSLASLYLSVNKIDMSKALAIVENHSRSFDLRHHNIDAKLALAIVEILNDTSLTSFCLFDNEIHSRKIQKMIINAIVNALTHNTSLTLLELGDNYTTPLTLLDSGYNEITVEGALAIANALQGNTSLTSLNLGNNHIGDARTLAIANALQGNTSLTLLDLSTNHISAAGALAIAANVLQGNTSLTSLNLRNNHIGDAGALAIANALQGNISLTSFGYTSVHIDIAHQVKINEIFREILLRNEALEDLFSQYREDGDFDTFLDGFSEKFSNMSKEMYLPVKNRIFQKFEIDIDRVKELRDIIIEKHPSSTSIFKEFFSFEAIQKYNLSYFIEKVLGNTKRIDILKCLKHAEAIQTILLNEKREQQNEECEQQNLIQGELEPIEGFNSDQTFITRFKYLSEFESQDLNNEAQPHIIALIRDSGNLAQLIFVNGNTIRYIYQPYDSSLDSITDIIQRYAESNPETHSEAIRSMIDNPLTCYSTKYLGEYHDETGVYYDAEDDVYYDPESGDIYYNAEGDPIESIPPNSDLAQDSISLDNLNFEKFYAQLAIFFDNSIIDKRDMTPEELEEAIEATRQLIEENGHSKCFDDNSNIYPCLPLANHEEVIVVNEIDKVHSMLFSSYLNELTSGEYA